MKPCLRMLISSHTVFNFNLLFQFINHSRKSLVYFFTVKVKKVHCESHGQHGQNPYGQIPYGFLTQKWADIYASMYHQHYFLAGLDSLECRCWWMLFLSIKLPPRTGQTA